MFIKVREKVFIAAIVWKAGQFRQKLIQTRIIHYCFLGVKEFYDLFKFDIISRFLILNFQARRNVLSGLAAYFSYHFVQG